MMHIRISLFAFLLLCSSAFAQKSPIKERNWRQATGQGRLFGTLAVPREGKANTLCIIVPGSGPTDRNGNSGVFVYANSYKMLSDSLVMNGYAVLRYDKRGVGESVYAFTNETELTFPLYCEDLGQVIRGQRKDGNFSKIVLIGHSEGSTVSLMTALKDTVDGFISLCGPGRSADSLLLTQLRTQPLKVREEAEMIIRTINNGESMPKVSESLQSLFRPSVQPYLRSWFAVKPYAEIAELSCPVLIVQGNTDIQVAVSEGERLKAARPSAELITIDQMNHVLKTAPEDGPRNIRTYGDPYMPLNKGLMPALLPFLKNVSGK